MPATTSVQMNVRKAGDKVSIIDITGEVNAAAEATLMQAYGKAAESKVRAIILNFQGLEYMNSSGIGLLVTLLIRVNREGYKLVAYGLSEHYRRIFDLTRLSEAIHLYPGESEAVAAVGV